MCRSDEGAYAWWRNLTKRWKVVGLKVGFEGEVLKMGQAGFDRWFVGV